MEQDKYFSSSQMGPYPKWFIALLLSFIPVFGLGIGILAFYVLWLARAEVWFLRLHGIPEGSFVLVGFLSFCFLIFLAIFFILLGWTLISAGLAQYRFETEGLYVKYPLRNEFLIPWDAFQQVCICRAEYTTRGPRKANDVICCVKHGEKTNLLGRWKTDNPFKYRSVICIAYTPYLAEGIAEKCPYDVPDLRETRTYRL